MEYKQLKFEECRDGVTEIRRKVFIEEQKCPEHMEWDEIEELDSTYFVALRGEQAVGCLRLRAIEPHLVKMERVAVLKEYRRRGIASELIRNAMMYAGAADETATTTTTTTTSICAYAQVSAIQAYVALGFTILSKVWIEDGTFIPHQTIFWGTPEAVDAFLKYQSEKTDVKYEDYDARSPLLLAKIEAFRGKLETLDTWQLCSLHVDLNDRVLTRLLRKRFVRFCAQVQNFIESRIGSRREIVECGDFLMRMADRKLNTGHFSEVDESWRKLYALVAFVQSFALFKCEKFEIALQIADRGLCMGRISEHRAPLRRLAWLAHQRLPTPSEDVIHPTFRCESSEETDRLEPLANQSISIDEISDDDEQCFERLIQAITEEKPLLVRGLATNWPAFAKWSIPFLLRELHSRTFPVEIGTKYSDEDWSQRMMTFGEFLANSENQRLYLAQHRLFDQCPHLKRDVIVPDVCFISDDSAEADVDMNMWIGPAGTVSPLHTDPRKNLFVQVHGTKLVRMVAPSDSPSVYPFDGMLSNTSQVDVESPNSSEHPEFAKIRVFDASVRAGDALFIPKKWWHYVRSTSPSISISFWFD